jgi:VanZ family protein
MRGVLVRIALAAYLLFLIFVSLRPGPAPLPGVWQIDKLYHFLAYAVLGFLLVLSFADRGSLKQRRPVPPRTLGWAFVASTLFGALMEVFQSFLPPREASFFDAAANAIGALAGVLAAGWVLSVFIGRISRMRIKEG